MNEYKIERSVPVPEGHQAICGLMPELRKTIKCMAHGDSFVFDGPATLAYRLAPKGSRIITRKIEGGKIRVWLTAKESKRNKKTYARNAHTHPGNAGHKGR